MQTDSTATIIAGLGAAVSIMATGYATILLAKLGRLTTKHEDLEKDFSKKIFALELEIERLKGTDKEQAAQLVEMKGNRLTVQEFQYATLAQNTTLAAQTKALDEIKAKIGVLDQSKASKSEMNLRAVRAPERAPPRRDDGVGDRELPSDPPPPRKKSPSIGRYGAE